MDPSWWPYGVLAAAWRPDGDDDGDDDGNGHGDSVQMAIASWRRDGVLVATGQMASWRRLEPGPSWQPQMAKLPLANAVTSILVLTSDGNLPRQQRIDNASFLHKFQI